MRLPLVLLAALALTGCMPREEWCKQNPGEDGCPARSSPAYLEGVPAPDSVVNAGGQCRTVKICEVD